MTKDNNRLVIGPGSSPHINCSLCGFSGQSYYHHCTGGKCHLCGQSHCKRLCFKCGKVVCRVHSHRDSYFDAVICDECHADFTNTFYLYPERAEECNCMVCKVKRKKK